MSHTEDMKEKLSALVDNELDDLEQHRVLAALERDAELRHVWERYHVMRSALRQDLDVMASPELMQRVTAAIGAEASPAMTRQQKIMRSVGTLAIAASVAVLAIGGVQWLNQPGSAPLTTLAKGQPVSQNIIRAGTTHWDVQEPEVESALNAFLIEHNEFSSSGFGGMMPYVRVVGYDSPNTAK